MGDVGETFEVFKEIKREERSKKEPSRFEYAKKNFDQLNMKYTEEYDRIIIEFKQGFIQFYPFTGWFCGRKPLGNIKGRGINNLLKAIGNIK